MTESPSDAAWARLAHGGSAVLLGERSPATPHDGPPLIPLRLDCARRPSALGFVRDALGEVGRLLGTYPSRWLPAELRTDPGLRRRLLEESPTRIWGGALGVALRDLAERAAGRAALVLEGVDEASEELAPVLLEILEQCRTLRMPVMLTASAEEPVGPVIGGLIETVRAREGEEAIFRLAAAPTRAATSDEVIEAAGEAPGASEPEEPAEGDRAEPVPEDVLRVLRALAVASPNAEIESIAALLDLDPLRVLESLQLARDAGVEVFDTGDGHVSLPPALAEALAESLLPSLARAYHQRLAAWHGRDVEPPSPPRAEPAAGAPREAPAAARAAASPRVEAAASHAEAAGDPELAAAQYRHALEEATAVGLVPQALDYGRRALEQIERLPGSETRRHLQLSVLASLALVHWQSAGLAEGLSLESARALLDRAAALVRPSDPPAMAAELDALRARILYDVGSPAALEEALEAVTRASRGWLAQGESLHAARLLNDEAAIWVRLGDPVRATHLLEQSLGLFGEPERDDEAARVEAAESHPRLARLLFHVEARPGRERDAVRVALENARAAEQLYTELGLPREVARTQETLGRLYQRAGDAKQAEAHLRAAAAAQQEHADPLGLARTAAALAELCTASGDVEAALDLLRRSIELNASAGSARGLAYVGDTLEALAQTLPPGSDDAVAALRARLAQAVRELGPAPDRSSPGAPF